MRRILWQKEDGRLLDRPENRVTLTQVGWMTSPGNEYIPLGAKVPDATVFAPVWIEGPND